MITTLTFRHALRAVAAVFATSVATSALAAFPTTLSGNTTGLDAGGTNYFDLDAIGAHELVSAPVPEPGAWAMLACGVVVLTRLRQRAARSQGCGCVPMA